MNKLSTGATASSMLTRTTRTQSDATAKAVSWSDASGLASRSRQVLQAPPVLNNTLISGFLGAGELLHSVRAHIAKPAKTAVQIQPCISVMRKSSLDATV